MLKKLLKYDMKAVWRIWWIIAVTVPVLAVIGGLTLGMLIRSAAVFVTDNMGAPLFTFFYIIGIFGVMACVMGMICVSVLTPILVYWRFYKNFFSDEGYLTFTLPVSRHTHLLSKTLNAFIWTSLTSVFMFVGIVSFVGIGLAFVPDVNIVASFMNSWSDLAEIIRNGMGGWSVVYLTEAILMAVASALYSICLIQLCITVGSVIAKKHKLLSAVGVYYGANFVISFVTRIFSSLISALSGAGVLDNIFYNLPANERFAILSIVFFVVIAAVAGVAAGMYILTRWLIDRKLNLA